MNIAIGSDHIGYNLKNKIVTYLVSKKDVDLVKDIGCDSDKSCDYPTFAHVVSEFLLYEPYQFGILICGTGQGMAITSNKYDHIRATVCWSSEISKLAREHNNSNVLCLPAKFINEGCVYDIVDTFLYTPFSEEQRHIKRISKIKPRVK
uniref:Ribose/galactose isomerase n=1 Tax=Pithovirus LCPAC302 TaxID=2506593 RepID=A0A481Z6K5_9VIRU|nr:MAG: ribose/galactose isomerase [Pithovirus LCPAC302]